jgi:hypothetical protein
LDDWYGPGRRCEHGGATDEEDDMKTPTMLWALALSALLVAGGCSAGTEPGSGAASDGATPDVSADTASAPAEWLFVVQAEGETTFDQATGRLSMPAGAVHAFTDRPHRDTRATSPQSFVNLWQSADPDSFAADPPNAVLTYWDASSGSAMPRTVVCVIVGDVGYSSADRVLSMQLRLLDPEDAVLPARLDGASLFVDSVPEGCSNSPDDSMNIEYFNMLNFNEAFVVQTQYDPATGQDQVWITCPERESPTIPPSSFDVRISTPDDTSSVSCYSGEKITLAQQDLAKTPNCRSGNFCEFVVTALNTQTGMQYSVTNVELELGSDSTIIPDLEPATLQICDNTLDQNLLDPGTLTEEPSSSVSLD